MKLCPSCFSEFRDEATQCDACLVNLVGEEEGKRLRAAAPQPLPEGATFVPVASSADPFEAEALVAALREANLPAFTRDRRRALMDVLVTSGSSSFWQILAPADRVTEARAAVEARRRELVAEEADAARAAEEEEAATENYEVVGESESEAAAGKWAELLASQGINAVLRTRDDVEVDGPAQGSTMTLVLVPREHLQRARAVINPG